MIQQGHHLVAPSSLWAVASGLPAHASTASPLVSPALPLAARTCCNRGTPLASQRDPSRMVVRADTRVNESCPRSASRCVRRVLQTVWHAGGLDTKWHVLAACARGPGAVWRRCLYGHATRSCFATPRPGASPRMSCGGHHSLDGVLKGFVLPESNDCPPGVPKGVICCTISFDCSSQLGTPVPVVDSGDSAV